MGGVGDRREPRQGGSQRCLRCRNHKPASAGLSRKKAAPSRNRRGCPLGAAQRKKRPAKKTCLKRADHLPASAKKREKECNGGGEIGENKGSRRWGPLAVKRKLQNDEMRGLRKNVPEKKPIPAGKTWMRGGGQSGKADHRNFYRGCSQEDRAEGFEKKRTRLCIYRKACSFPDTVSRGGRYERGMRGKVC